MQTSSTQAQPVIGAHRAWLPLVVFLVTFGLALTAAYYADVVSRTRERIRFDHAAAQALASMEGVVRRYLALLQAVQSIGVAHMNMSVDQFRSYVKALDLPKNYPGIEGLGVAMRIRSDQKNDAVQKAQAKGMAGFHIWPESDETNLCPVLILEPPDENNVAALGYDLFTDPEQRAAAQRAAETGEPAATGKLTLAKALAGHRDAGFIILYPLYRSGNVPARARERNQEWGGFVCCFFRADDFCKALLSGQGNSLVGFRIHDGTKPNSANFLYDSGEERTFRAARNRLNSTNTLVIASRPWTLIGSPKPAFLAAAGVNFSRFILLAGALASSLLAWLTAIQFKARVAAETAAARLRQSENERSILLEREQNARRHAEAAEVRFRVLNQELEQRVAERTSQLEAANKGLESFSYSVSHDLRAPLRHISGYAELLSAQAGPVLGDENGRFVKVIADSARRMNQLIDDLLVFSRNGREPFDQTEINLRSLCEETIRSLAPDAKDRNIRWTIGDLRVVRGDPAMLRQVFANLLGNAIKYTRNRAQAEIEIGCQDDNAGEIVVFVRDNGAGFDMKYASKLFGVFQRLHTATEFEGTGIGLANVNRIVTRHGGRCWAEGVVDEGSTFYFSLPKRIEE